MDATPTTPEPELGRADIHCHLLPGLDDGALDLETSLAMARIAIEDGTTDLAATPHANFQFDFSPERNRELKAELESRLEGKLRLYLGCDFHLSIENIQDAAAHFGKYSLNGGRYLLVEFPDPFPPAAHEDGLRQLLEAGYVPVLTHPERNRVFQNTPRLIDDFVRLGCVVQVTAAAFLGDWGRAAQKMAEDLLRRDLVHAIASDGHSPRGRAPRLAEAAGRIAQLRELGLADVLSCGNPQAMLRNQDLPYHPRPSESRKKPGLLARLGFAARN